MEERIFKEEQNHLTQVYGKLEDMQQDLEEKVHQMKDKASEEKKDIRDNLTLNFDSGTDTMETYIEFEVMNHVIDSYNIENAAAEARLASVRQLLKAPYFARVTLQFPEEEESEDYYIGSTSVSENGYDQLVIDWRSPIAETYYNQENGHTSYQVDGRTVPVELLLRRQFDLKGKKLNSYFDTQIAIEDPMLLKSLSDSRSQQLQAITATIQKEQNEVIRYPDVPVLLVNGIAGSGKTSVLLQRIAYLFFRQRKTLRPEDVYLVTLNQVFQQYISGVLPDLGERNPNTITWHALLDMAGVPARESGFNTDAKCLLEIDRRLPGLKLEKEDFRAVRQGSTTLLGPAAIAAVAEEFNHIPTGIRLIQVMIDELETRAKRAVRSKENAEEDSSATSPEDEKENNRIQSRYGGAFSMIRKCAWLNIDRIGLRLLGKERLTGTEWLYLKMALTGDGDRNAKYVMIDEVQDYSLSQLMVMERYFPSARFMLLGDEFQAIRKGTASFADVHTFFESKGKPVTELPLMTSYRSSPEITESFTGLLPDKQKILVRSVQRPGTPPVICRTSSRTEYISALRSVIKKYQNSQGLTAVICSCKTSQDKLLSLLAEDAPAMIRRDESLPDQGVFCIELRLAKGLEFDTVIIPDADEKNYPADELSRHMLYTAMSRATLRLEIFAEETMTPLL